jgi:hypothetical protein
MAFSAALARLNASTLRTFGEALVERGGYPACTGVFDHRTVAEDVLADMPGDVRGMFSGPVPILTLADADAVEVEYGSALTVDGVAYTVRESRPSGAGLTVLTLRRT